MFGHVSSRLFGCIVDHEMSCKSIMHSELTREQSIGVHCVVSRRPKRTQRTQKTHFQTQNVPLNMVH